MSTELYEAKQLVDEIHEAAGVPEEKNPDIYAMTLSHIGHLLLEMDRKGKTMSEQRMRVGQKKDELIRELISLREQGIVRGEGETGRRPPPSRVNLSQINVKRMH